MGTVSIIILFIINIVVIANDIEMDHNFAIGMCSYTDL